MWVHFPVDGLKVAVVGLPEFTDEWVNVTVAPWPVLGVAGVSLPQVIILLETANAL